MASWASWAGASSRLAGGGLVATALAPERASAYTDICGHTFTTNECPHPFGKFARTDAFGYPVHPKYGYPVDDDGEIYTDPATQVRRKVCEQRVADQELVSLSQLSQYQHLALK